MLAPSETVVYTSMSQMLEIQEDYKETPVECSKKQRENAGSATIWPYASRCWRTVPGTDAHEKTSATASREKVQNVNFALFFAAFVQQEITHAADRAISCDQKRQGDDGTLRELSCMLSLWRAAFYLLFHIYVARHYPTTITKISLS